MNSITHIFDDHINVIEKLRDSQLELVSITDIFIQTITNSGRFFWIGNGGSAATCLHLSAELVGRFQDKKRSPLNSVALTADSILITALGNDFSFENIFVRQLQALCTSQDVVIALSTSGRSVNVLQGMKQAHSLGAKVIGITGNAAPDTFRQSADICIVIQSAITARIQEAEIVIGHILCSLIEERLNSLEPS